MKNAFVLSTCISLAVILPAVASDLPIKKRPANAAVSSATAPQGAERWAGLYAGAHAGYGFGNINARDLEDGSRLNYDNTGWSTGIHAGYNVVTGPWVLGLEGEFTATGIKGRKIESDVDDSGVREAFTLRTSFPWIASVGPRVGYSMGNALIYATGGVAVGRDRLKVTESDGDVAKKTEARIGFSVGGGVEYALDKHWSVRGDYRYYNLGRKTYRDADPESGDITGVRVKADAHIFRVGLTYDFGEVR